MFVSTARPLGLGLASTLFVGLNAAATQAATFTLSNDALTIEIRQDNGAIARAFFEGSDFFNPGTPISDYGFQNGTDTHTFRINTTTGWTKQPVSVASGQNSVVVTGIFTGGDANVEFTRTYSLLKGLNVLRVQTDFVNRGDDVALRYFDTFDPDQGVARDNGFETYNESFTLQTEAGLARAARATELDGLTVAIASVSSDAIVGQTTGIGITQGENLNLFFESPINGGGNFADFGSHVGAFKMILKAGERRSIRYDQAYAVSPQGAIAQLQAANRRPSVPVPEPVSLASLALIATWGVARKLRGKSTP